MGDFQAIARERPLCSLPQSNPGLTDRAEQFVDFYYKTFDENRANLAALYVTSPATSSRSALD